MAIDSRPLQEPLTEDEYRQIALEKLGEQSLLNVLDAGEFGIWNLELATGTVFRSLHHDRIFGYQDHQPHWTYTRFLEHVLPEEREEVNQAFLDAISDHGEWDFSCRIRWPDGSIHWIWKQGRPQYNDRHEAVRLVGLVRDITNRKRIEQELIAEKDLLEGRVLERTAELADTIFLLQQEIADRKLAEAKIMRLNRLYALLSHTNAAIVRASSRHQ